MRAEIRAKIGSVAAAQEAIERWNARLARLPWLDDVSIPIPESVIRGQVLVRVEHKPRPGGRPLGSKTKSKFIERSKPEPVRAGRPVEPVMRPLVYQPPLPLAGPSTSVCRHRGCPWPPVHNDLCRQHLMDEHTEQSPVGSSLPWMMDQAPDLSGIKWKRGS